MVIDACRMAGHKHPIGLILIGDGRDRAKIARHIAGNPHVQLLAPIADRALLASVMASADALIHGCEAETFGLVAAEAAASGLPLIVPDEGGAADMVTEQTGECYKAGDTAAAGAAIERLLQRDRTALRKAAFLQATMAGTIDSHFEMLFAEYASLSFAARRAA